MLETVHQNARYVSFTLCSLDPTKVPFNNELSHLGMMGVFHCDQLHVKSARSRHSLDLIRIIVSRQKVACQ